MDATKVDQWLGRLGRLLLPTRCLVCREPGANGRDLCASCTAALPWMGSACLRCALPLPGTDGNADAETGTGTGAAPAAAIPCICGQCLRSPPPLDQVRAAFLYAPPLDRLLPRFKFHEDLAAGRLLAQLMLERWRALPRPEAIVPVPLHRQRLRSRGYDQALELARPLARALDVALLPGALLRQRATRPQSELEAGARQANLRDAFALGAGADLPGHVALLDDVMTTGATLHAAARALRRAGVARVDAWVCARVP